MTARPARRTTPRPRRTIWSLAAILIAGLIGALGFAAPAAAAEPDPSRDGSSSLTIQKQRATSDYTVYRVTSKTDPNAPDLTTNAGWVQVSDLYAVVGSNPTQAALDGAGYNTTEITPTSTGNGEESFTGLEFGLYYVVESTPAPGYDPVLPFLVTVPTTDQANTEAWVYDVVVAPKNRAIQSKQVADADVIHGDTTAGSGGDVLTWSIRGNIEDGDEDLYTITDDLDARLRYVSADLSLDADGTVTPLVPTTDYTVATTPQAGGVTRVTWSVTPAGLAKINAADPATTVVLAEVDTSVVFQGTGAIPNEATITQTGNIVTHVPAITTRWGKIIVTKQNPAGTTLAGAEFEVFASHTNDFATAETTGLTGTTGANGQATIGSLRFSDYANGDFVGTSNPAYLYYWLVETAAPQGFELLPEPVPFQLTADNAPDYLLGLSVENVPSNGGFRLPLTGGTFQTFLFYGAGALLLAGAVLLIVRMRRARA